MGFSPGECDDSLFAANTQANYLSHFGAYLTSFGNTELKWQNTYQWNFGIELKTLHERLGIRVQLYRKMTDNTVADVFLPISHGFNTYKANIGSIFE